MDPFARLVLPQNDTPENRRERQLVLTEMQGRYRFDYHTATLAGLPMAATPIPVEISLVWAAGVAQLVLALGENLINIAVPNFIDFDIRIPLQVGPSASRAIETAPAGAAREAPGAAGSSPLASEAAAFQRDLEDARAVLAGLVHTSDMDEVEHQLGSWLSDLIGKLVAFLGKLLGIYGRPSDLADYQRQFHTLPLPWPAGVFQSDEMFAQLRVAGPNPVVIHRASADDLRGLTLGDHGAAIHDALARGALFVADYAVLAGLKPGTNPAPKYVFAPKALFAVAAGERSLRPVAIQTSPGAAVVFPGGGTPWEIAKIIVNMADGNYHELISHLGLTHLVTEPFAIATHRQLDPKHPLFVLLAPHFAGTLFINYAAQTLLITDGGAVEQLLTGTIETSRQLSASAVKAVRYNQSFLPLALAARGVDDAEALPDYPYRDDALALWNAIHAWVTAYVQIYYPTPADVTGDYELQAWVAELAAKQGGSIQDIGEHQVDGAPRIETADYLAKLLTQVIFTASVQHAAVNFPQRTIMSYTPAMPLAAYAPFPAPPGAPATQILDILPPLQMGLLQQVVGTALGGVQYTALGQYGGQLATLQVADALSAYQRALQNIEVEIQRATALGTRTPYTTLLPSLIPQSINI